MNKKILFLANHDVGLYNFRRELIEKLLSDGYEVIISSPFGERINDFIEMGCLYQEAHISRHGMNVFEDLKLILHYRKLIKKVKPLVVLTYTIKPNLYGGIAARSMKTSYITNVTGLGSALQNKGLVQKIIVALYRIAFKKAFFVFFQNEGNLKFFENKRITHKRGKLLPGSGVNITKFIPLPLPNGEQTSFVFIARVMKDKGIDHYLEAAKAIKSKYKHTNFYICGPCEESYEEILNDYQEAGIITYLGMIPDIREILEITHCTVLPSYHEGLSNVLLESAASSRPNITTNINGCKEVVEDGVTGFLVEPKSTEALILGIEKFLCLDDEERKKMGENGRLKVEKEFDRQIVVQAYMQIINEIVKAPSLEHKEEGVDGFIREAHQ